MKKIFSICFLFILVGLSHAQKKERPKVGLVLSGGGAKGLAHIGVLKVIEQAGVEIDYIAGTSMGAIIGGLYASGYTAAELDSIFQRVDADALIQDYVPRAAKSFYEKKNDEIYALTLPFDNFKLGIPKALSKGMYNYNLLSRLLGHVRYLRDFNDLEIPFLCVATDAETGEAVILNQGSLPQAILASGAFPSLYTPVEIDGRMLIDGGVVNNYPLNELKQMGADVIIGVDVQDGLKDREAIEGATDLLLQISNYSTIKQMNEKRALTDVYIKPDIAGFTVVSFGEGKEIIERGRLAGLQVLDQLKALGTEVKAQPKHYLPKFNDTLKISDIKLNPLSTYTSSYVQGKLGFRSNTPITYQMLGNGIDNLNGSQNFSAISYKFERDGEYDVFDIHLDENKVKRLLRLGLHYDGLYKSAALVNLTQKKFLFKNDVASLDIALGDNFRYNFNYYIDNGFYWSVGLSSKYNNFSRTVPFSAVEGAGSQPNNLSVNYKEIANRLYFQTIFVQKFLIGVGLEHKYFDVKSPTLNPDDRTMDRGNYFSGHAYLRFDSYDNKYFPTKGFVFKGEYTNYFYSTDFNHNFENFSQVTGEIGLVKTLFNRFSAEVHSEIGFTVGSESSPFFNFFLGGYGFAESYNIIPFYGYDFLGVFENSYVKTRVELDYEFIRKNHINLAVNFANVGRSLFSTTEWISPPSYTGYALGYGMETLLGPIEIKHSWSPETNNHFTWFSVGFWF